MPARPLRLFAALPLVAVLASADVTLAPPFQDRAVLQRDQPLPVWGRADAGEAVTITYASAGLTRTAATIADTDGRWRVTLDPLPAEPAPATLTATGKNTLVLSDILVGDVWLASGQSNMEWALDWGNANRVLNAKAEIAAADFPLIRQLKVRTAVAETPADTLRGDWRPALPASVGNFSATAYFFARELHRELGGVPIGIVNATWGGTQIEAWTPATALAADPAGPAARKRWDEILAAYPEKKARYDEALAGWQSEKAAALAAGTPFKKHPPFAPQGPGGMRTPSGLYNAMVHPLVPMALRGVIWYQGESNVIRPADYHTLFPTLIHSWRAAFDRDDLAFLWVQLANYNDKGGQRTDWAWLREAQHAALRLPATGQAVAIDIGESGNVHPANKQEAGRRLALLALARVYDRPGVIDTGPVFARAIFERDGSASILFTDTHRGLVCGEPPAGFELAAEDRVFHPADHIEIDGDRVTLRARAVPSPVAVRYAWRNEPRAALANGAGLPAAPFRTDDWPLPSQTQP